MLKLSFILILSSNLRLNLKLESAVEVEFEPEKIHRRRLLFATEMR